MNFVISFGRRVCLGFISVVAAALLLLVTKELLFPSPAYGDQNDEPAHICVDTNSPAIYDAMAHLIYEAGYQLTSCSVAYDIRVHLEKDEEYVDAGTSLVQAHARFYEYGIHAPADVHTTSSGEYYRYSDQDRRFQQLLREIEEMFVHDRESYERIFQELLSDLS